MPLKPILKKALFGESDIFYQSSDSARYFLSFKAHARFFYT